MPFSISCYACRSVLWDSQDLELSPLRVCLLKPLGVPQSHLILDPRRGHAELLRGDLAHVFKAVDVSDVSEEYLNQIGGSKGKTLYGFLNCGMCGKLVAKRLKMDGVMMYCLSGKNAIILSFFDPNGTGALLGVYQRWKDVYNHCSIESEYAQEYLPLYDGKPGAMIESDFVPVISVEELDPSKQRIDAENQIQLMSSILAPRRYPTLQELTRKTDWNPNLTTHLPRPYQLEMIALGITRNVLIYMPTGSGKTLVACHILASFEAMKVVGQRQYGVMVVQKIPLAFQQAQVIEKVTGLSVGVLCGDTMVEMALKLRENPFSYHAYVATAQCLLNCLNQGTLSFSNMTCLILDEAHHAKGRDSYSMIMELYQEVSQATHNDSGDRMRVIGMTASPASGHNLSDLDDSLRIIAKKLDDAQLATPIVFRKSLSDHVFRPEINFHCLPTTIDQADPKYALLSKFHEMIDIMGNKALEALSITSLKDYCRLDWSWMKEENYRGLVRQLRHQIEEAILHSKESFWEDILKDVILWQNLLSVNEIMSVIGLKYSLTELESLLGGIEKGHPLQLKLKLFMAKLKVTLQKDPGISLKSKILIDVLKKVMDDEIRMETAASSRNRIIVFVDMRKTSRLLTELIKEDRSLANYFRPQFIVGSDRNTIDGMNWQDEQKLILDQFRNGSCRLLIATSVIQEGIDVPICDRLIAFDAITNLTGFVQGLGRARFEKSTIHLICSEKEEQFYQDLTRSETMVKSLVQQQIAETWMTRSVFKDLHVVVNRVLDVQQARKAVVNSGLNVKTSGNAVSEKEERIIKVPVKYVSSDPHQDLESLIELLEKSKDFEICHESFNFSCSMDEEHRQILVNVLFKISELTPRNSVSSYRVLFEKLEGLGLFSWGFFTQTSKCWPSVFDFREEEVAPNSLSFAVSESFHWDSGFQVSLGQLVSPNEFCYLDQLPSDWVVGLALEARFRCLNIFHMDNRSIEAFGDDSSVQVFNWHVPFSIIDKFIVIEPIPNGINLVIPLSRPAILRFAWIAKEASKSSKLFQLLVSTPPSWTLIGNWGDRSPNSIAGNVWSISIRLEGLFDPRDYQNAVSGIVTSCIASGLEVRLGNVNVSKGIVYDNCPFPKTSDFKLLYQWEIFKTYCASTFFMRMDSGTADLLGLFYKNHGSMRTLNLLSDIMLKCQYNRYLDIKMCVEKYPIDTEIRDDADTLYSNDNDNFVLCRWLVCTPSRVVVFPERPIQGNRVIRHYGPDRFIRLLFRDDDLSSRWSMAGDDTSFIIHERIGHWLRNGICVGNRIYRFVACSSSQLREHGAWFYASESDDLHSPSILQEPIIDAEYIRKWLGDMSGINNVAKYISRLGQSFSSSICSLELLAEEYEEIPDIYSMPAVPETDALISYDQDTSIGEKNESEDGEFMEDFEALALEKDGNEDGLSELKKGLAQSESRRHEPECLTDGVGRMNYKLAMKIREKLELPVVPSAVQIRYAGFKGVLSLYCPTEFPAATNHIKVVDTDTCIETSPKAWFRPSMKKYESTLTSLDILFIAASQPCHLNRQIIQILSTLGVKDQVFIDLQEEMLKDILESLTNPETARKHLYSAGLPANLAMVIRDENFDSDLVVSDAFWKSIVKTKVSQYLRDVVDKTKLFVREGRVAMGIADESGLLNSDEVFIQISPLRNSYYDDTEYREWEENSFLGHEKTHVVVGEVVIAKNPCMHPGDVRRLKAVYNPILAKYYVNTLVFPTTSLKSIPNQCSGSDLDGDLYFVSWDPRLLPQELCESMSYQPPPSISMGRSIDFEDLVRFYLDYIQMDQLGAIANSHMAYADRLPSGVRSQVCRELSYLFSLAVDFPKSGVVVTLPSIAKVKEYPDFMNRTGKMKYRSRKVLGYLYRSVCLLIAHQTYQDGSIQEQLMNSESVICEEDPDFKELTNVYESFQAEMNRIKFRYSFESEESMLLGTMPVTAEEKQHAFDQQRFAKMEVDYCLERVKDWVQGKLEKFASEDVAIESMKFLIEEFIGARERQGLGTMKSFTWVMRPLLVKGKTDSNEKSLFWSNLQNELEEMVDKMDETGKYNIIDRLCQYEGVLYEYQYHIISETKNPSFPILSTVDLSVLIHGISSFNDETSPIVCTLSEVNDQASLLEWLSFIPDVSEIKRVDGRICYRLPVIANLPPILIVLKEDVVDIFNHLKATLKRYPMLKPLLGFLIQWQLKTGLSSLFYDLQGMTHALLCFDLIKIFLDFLCEKYKMSLSDETLFCYDDSNHDKFNESFFNLLNDCLWQEEKSMDRNENNLQLAGIEIFAEFMKCQANVKDSESCLGRRIRDVSFLTYFSICSEASLERFVAFLPRICRLLDEGTGSEEGQRKRKGGSGGGQLSWQFRMGRRGAAMGRLFLADSSIILVEQGQGADERDIDFVKVVLYKGDRQTEHKHGIKYCPDQIGKGCVSVRGGKIHNLLYERFRGHLKQKLMMMADNAMDLTAVCSSTAWKPRLTVKWGSYYWTSVSRVFLESIENKVSIDMVHVALEKGFKRSRRRMERQQSNRERLVNGSVEKEVGKALTKLKQNLGSGKGGGGGGRGGNASFKVNYQSKEGKRSRIRRVGGIGSSFFPSITACVYERLQTCKLFDTKYGTLVTKDVMHLSISIPTIGDCLVTYDGMNATLMRIVTGVRVFCQIDWKSLNPLKDIRWTLSAARTVYNTDLDEPVHDVTADLLAMLQQLVNLPLGYGREPIDEANFYVSTASTITVTGPLSGCVVSMRRILEKNFTSYAEPDSTWTFSHTVEYYPSSNGSNGNAVDMDDELERNSEDDEDFDGQDDEYNEIPSIQGGGTCVWVRGQEGYSCDANFLRFEDFVSHARHEDLIRNAFDTGMVVSGL